ncbi:MAG: hypothetical protein J6Z22_01070, partial [Lachnospiraceae bacterium]|nr:hypothetical protein [Lachnospiraceae bacterium]
MKYIIEIEDEPFGRNDDPVIPHGMDELYRAKGFNSLVFDKNGLDKLIPIDKELEEAYQRGLDEGYNNGYSQGLKDGCHKSDTEEYQQGLDDAWECAKKISLMSPDEIEKVFPGAAKNNRYNLGYSGTEAIEKLKAYEQKKAESEIKVGDIITDGKINYLVIDITDNSYVALQGTDFEPSYIGKDYIKSYHNL